MIEATESEILNTFSNQKLQGNTSTASALEHVECPSVVVESGASDSSHSVVEELPVIGDHEPSSAFSEIHVSRDTAHDSNVERSGCSTSAIDLDDDTDVEAEAPTFDFLITSLRYWASTSP